MAQEDRPNAYPELPEWCIDEIEGERLVGAPSPLVFMYLVSYLTKVDFRIGWVLHDSNEQNARYRAHLQQWILMEGANLFFVHWVHARIHGVTHRGFSNPGLCENHGRFTGLLTRWLVAVDYMIESWGFDNLLAGTGILTHLVQAAAERDRGFVWWSISDAAVMEVGRYLRYAFRTSEKDNVPVHRARVNGEWRYLVLICVRFRTVRTIFDFRTVEQHRVARLKDNPHANGTLVDYTTRCYVTWRIVIIAGAPIRHSLPVGVLAGDEDLLLL